MSNTSGGNTRPRSQNVVVRPAVRANNSPAMALADALVRATPGSPGISAARASTYRKYGTLAADQTGIDTQKGEKRSRYGSAGAGRPGNWELGVGSCGVG